MRKLFVAGEFQNRIIESIRAQLRQSDLGTHIRILGEAGIGKTRLVLEATKTDDLAPLIIYTTADSFYDSELMTELIRGKFHAILVIDECDPDKRSLLTNKLKVTAQAEALKRG